MTNNEKKSYQEIDNKELNVKKINDDMKLLFKKIKSEKKKKNKNDDNFKQFEFLLVRIKYGEKPDKL